MRNILYQIFLFEKFGMKQVKKVKNHKIRMRNILYQIFLFEKLYRYWRRSRSV